MHVLIQDLSALQTVTRVLTRGGAAPDVTHHTYESKRVGQVSALWITTFIHRLL